MKKLFILLLVLILASCSPETEEEFTLTIKGNGGAPLTQVFILDCGDPLPAHIDVRRPGYTLEFISQTRYLVGESVLWYDWNGDIAATGRVYDACEDLTLYALWTLN
jgi:hypothetical protein